MKNESFYKTKFVKAVRKSGHYARRIEDEYGVGFPDMIIIPTGYPVFFIEAKVVTGPTFQPTSRQFLELERLSRTPSAVSCLMGFRESEVYLHPSAARAKVSECVKMTHGETPIDFVIRYYNERVLNVRG